MFRLGDGFEKLEFRPGGKAFGINGIQVLSDGIQFWLSGRALGFPGKVLAINGIQVCLGGMQFLGPTLTLPRGEGIFWNELNANGRELPG